MTEQQDQPSSMREEVLARVNARREAVLQTALVRAAANGLVLRGDVTPWMQGSQQLRALLNSITKLQTIFSKRTQNKNPKKLRLRTEYSESAILSP